jgi:predicted GNAT family acetyltransferase
MAASSRKTPNGVVVSLVYTSKEHRGKGYASACVASLSKLLLEKGNKFCALFTDLANPTSNSIYMKMGYKPICDFDNYSF